MLFPIRSFLGSYVVSEKIEPDLRLVLAKRIAALGDELMPHTEFVVIERGDTENDIVRETGASPLREPYDAVRFGQPGFHPHWDWLVDHGGCFEMCLSFGSSFARLLYVPDADGIIPDLRAMCRAFATKA